ncbi:alpha-lytic protease prodomain-containing protein [Micromonospora sp. BRA006-A]|nr:alpha-lytic protease prodomain-containing protein [Micromonospora sp. BRA006-A]
MDAAGADASPDVAGWYVDVADNAVVVIARPGGGRRPTARRRRRVEGRDGPGADRRRGPASAVRRAGRRRLPDQQRGPLLGRLLRGRRVRHRWALRPSGGPHHRIEPGRPGHVRRVLVPG